MKRCLEFFKSGALFLPWPVFVNGEKVLGARLSPHKICETKCTVYECKQYKGRFLGETCSQGLDYYQTKIGENTLVVYGVMKNRDLLIKKSKLFKSSMKGRHVAETEFKSWLDKLKKHYAIMGKIEEEVISESLHPLHDTMKWAEQISNIAENMIVNKKDKSFQENFEASSANLKSLYKSSQLLTDTFGLVTIYANPESASYGNKKPIEIYKLLHKIQIILNVAEAAKKNKKINIKGQGYKTYYVYDSFNLLLLSLLQNAIKYSQTKDIDVYVEENIKGLNISVNSIGPYIDDNEINKLFDKGYRGRWANKLDSQGMGVGLYIARIIASAHGIIIKVDSEKLSYSNGDIPQANNKFSFFYSIN